MMHCLGWCHIMTFNFQVPVGLIVDLVGTFHWAPEAEAVQHPSNGASDAAPVEPEPDPALKEKEVPLSALFYVI